MLQRKIMAITLYSRSYFDMFRGPFFSGHGVHLYISLFATWTAQNGKRQKHKNNNQSKQSGKQIIDLT